MNYRRGEAFDGVNTPPKSPEVGQPSPVDIIMTSEGACPTGRGDFYSPL
ncbi:MAG TPA: hypothetical protein ACFYEE_07790 [Candidatus Wujingus californicus]|nr:hypothetical protein [Candidatus Brocadiales bacterium]